MSNTETPVKSPTSRTRLRKLPFTHGIEIENFITNRLGDILEDGKELVAVWDQMFNGALKFLQSLTSSTANVPEYIRNKIRRVTRKDVERHGKIIRYVQIQYLFNGKVIAVNVFGPDPNISQITWLLELVTPPCEYLEELDWWINTLYIAASASITKGYNVQPLGFNPYQSEYRAGVTCGEHHHIDNFQSTKEKYAVYNMIRAYIPHLIAISSTSPFIDRKTTGRIILKQGSDGRTLILAPDCVRSIRLKENSGQLGPNIPEYLPYVSSSFTRQQFSRYVRKEIPDDRYVDASPFTDYGTIEFRFFDTQFDQRIRLAIIILIQALALKASKLISSGQIIPDVKGNTIFEHRKRAVNFGMFAKFQGDPSIESSGGEFVKYYNHNPETGGPPGKIFDSLKSLLIWLKPELVELKVTEQDISPLLIMLWGTARIAPPISTTTFMFYLFEKNHGNVGNIINSLSLLNGKPRSSFCEILGRPSTDFSGLLSAKAVTPKRTTSSTKSTLARKLQQDSRLRRKKVMAKEQARLKAKQALKTKMLREKVKKERELEKKRQERIQKLEKAKKPLPKPIPQRTTRPITRSTISQISKSKPISPPPKKVKSVISKQAPKPKMKTAPISRKKTTSTSRKPKSKKVAAKKPVKTRSTKSKKIITTTAIRNKRPTTTQRKPAQSYASVANSRNATRREISIPKPTITKKTINRNYTRKSTSNRTAISTTKVTKVFDQEPYRDSKFIRGLSVVNLPSRTTSNLIVPVIRLKWRRSIIQSMTSFPITIEAEVESLNSSNKFTKKAFQEKINLEAASLKEQCYLPIPIDINNAHGDFKIKFIVRNLKSRKVLATDFQSFMRIKSSKEKLPSIEKLSIPPNQVGDSSVNIKVKTEKRNIRGRITLWALSQRGVLRLYEKKGRFNQRTFSLDIPILIPPSMCSSNWMVYAEFTYRSTTISSYVQTSPPLAKIATIALSGNPPLKQRVNSNYKSEITPKLNFKTRCELREVEIVQYDNNSIRVLKRYKLRMRIKKGEKFILESFDWRPPSMRKGLFRSYKQKTVSFYCRIYDNVGLIDDSLIGLTETPRITVFKSSK